MFKTRGKHARPVRRAISASGVGLAAVMAAVLGLTTAGGASAATITVDETSLGSGWNAVVAGQGTTAFVDADSPLGGGALQLDTNADNADKAALYTTLHSGTKIADITTLSYWTKVRAQSNAAGNASYQLGIDLDGDLSTTGDQTTMIYEPYWQNGGLGDPQPNVPDWHEWDVDTGLFWSSRTIGTTFTAGQGGPPFYTLADIKAAAGTTGVVTDVGVNLGTYNPDYTILTDGLTFNETTYDFQPRGVTKDDCKDGGWATNFAEEFVNQGDCVSFFASNGKTHS